MDLSTVEQCSKSAHGLVGAQGPLQDLSRTVWKHESKHLGKTCDMFKIGNAINYGILLICLAGLNQDIPKYDFEIQYLESNTSLDNFPLEFSFMVRSLWSLSNLGAPLWFYHFWHTLRKSNIPMENPPRISDFLAKTSFHRGFPRPCWITQGYLQSNPIFDST